MDPKNPITWNRYVYANDDPVNRNDPNGLCNVLIAGFTEHSSDDEAINQFASDNGSIQAFPYAGGNIPSGLLSVASQGLLSANAATKAAAVAIYLASVEDPDNPIDVVTFSGGAQAFSSAIALLPGLQGRIGDVTYVSPGAVPNGPTLFAGTTTTAILGRGSATEIAVTATGLSDVPEKTNISLSPCGHSFACQLQYAMPNLINTGTPCPQPVTISSPPPSIQGFPFNSLFGPFGPLEIVYSGIQYEQVTSTISFAP